MKPITDYTTILNESQKLSSNNLGLTVSQLKNIENFLKDKLVGGILTVTYQFEKDDINSSSNNITFPGMEKEIEHVFAHALEQIITTPIRSLMAKANLKNINIDSTKLDSYIVINNKPYYIEIKTSSHDLNKSGTTTNNSRGIWLNTEKEKNDLKDGILIFVVYDETNKQNGTCVITNVYVRTPDLIEISQNPHRSRYAITKLLNIE